jgi:type IV pilus assembly protein PilB
MANATKPLILCVDDDKGILNISERVLGNAGYAVITADSGTAALQILHDHKPELILLDVIMPGMDGYEVCARLQGNKELAYIPVIFVSALGEEENKARAFALGAVDYLVKPVSAATLLHKVAARVKTRRQWEEFRQRPGAKDVGGIPSDFARFKTFLTQRFPIPPDKHALVSALTPAELYTAAGEFAMTEGQVAQAVAEFLRLPYRPSLALAEVALGVLPTPFCRANLVVAINGADGKRGFVLSNPFNWELVNLLKKSSSQPPTLIVTEPQNLARLFQDALPAQKPSPAVPLAPQASIVDIEEQLRERYQVDEKKVLSAEGVAAEAEPLVLLVHQLIENAYVMGASDIHIEPWEEEVVIRYRIDGELRVVNRLRPHSLIRPIVSRIKVMSDLDIAERRLPQDGRLIFKNFSGKGLDFDLRVSVAPMHLGEKVVMRILDKQKSVLPLSDLGFSARHLAIYRAKITSPHGMILHTGPTGSGKSMTLYAALNEIRRPEINIQTIEDPIEYTLAGINQLQVHPDIGLTFQTALRSYLRQDPDVILVGEIRDRETADIAVKAALTGHLLLSTLHTNDAPSTVVRLIEMGIEPFLVSSSIVLLCAQRLLRRLCPNCREAYRPTREQSGLVGLAPDDANAVLYRAKGCEACNGIGYKGRIGIHEILVPDDETRHAINAKGVTAETLKRLAVERCGMTTLYWDAMEKVAAGICSLEEVLLKVPKDEFDSRPAWLRDRGARHFTESPDGGRPVGDTLLVSPAAPGQAVVVG